MKVVCTQEFNIGDIKLTKGKMYKANKSSISGQTHYVIVNDDGISGHYHKTHFMNLEEYRITKLKEIGI